ncbi:FKBP-type peptidyl-prolyl cis-trans isomerase [Gabonibacter massiliensis]|uniref:FKBP-type peptidyl-prolyl cis-trans isomerase n=1 Tax=Gabonibacter massiliensis TaxID=1720195 RepID=UPI00073E6471|nr:FKBP-type peptidyl-prolyl cis-trans isomerase [Gabonibacter massiliensis]
MGKYCILSVCVLMLSFWSCSEEKEDDLIDVLEKESVDIREYLRENVTTPVTTVCFYSVKGLPIDSIYIFNNDKTGTLVKEDEYALIDYDVLDLNGKYMDSTDPQQKLDSTYVRTYAMGGPVYNVLDTANKFNYIGEALKYIGEGKTGEMIVPSKLGSQNGKSLLYKLQIKRVIPDFKGYEDALIQSYIDNHIQDKIGEPVEIRRNDSIAYLVMTHQGSGVSVIKEGDTVSISHEAYVLTEGLLKQYEVWDSVTMIHPLAPRNGTILEVYAKALTYLHEGDEATIIVPHVLGYGRAGVKSASGQILIPSFSTLVYTLKVKRVGIFTPPENPETGRGNEP